MKIKLYYFYNGGTFVLDENRIEASTIDWRGDYVGYRVFIKTEEVDIPDCAKPSDGELAKAITETLNNEKQSILAETHNKIAKIDEKIHQLAALTYSPEEA